MPWKWYDSKVIKIEDQTPTTKRFFVEIPKEESIDFTAGQFVTMDLPISDKRLKRWRSYSVANVPNGSNVLEFCVVKLDGGAATEYLFNDLSVGEKIRFKGPDGTFVLPDPIEKDLVLISTGTGVAPFRSMLIDLQKSKKPHKNIHLIFGTRYENGILYREEFEQMEKDIPGFKYSIALSREENWDGVKGYLHQIYMEEYKDVRPDVDFYICGWSNMIDDAVANLDSEIGL